jgi:O-antigen/teichoic acid export membrane protein
VVIVMSVIGKALYLFDISAAKGHGQYSVEALCTVAVSLANAAAVVGLVLAGAGLLAYCILFALASVAYGLLAALLLRRKGVRAVRGGIDAQLMARIRQHLFWTVILTVVGAFANKSVETFLLNAYVGPAEVGFFTIAAALTRGGGELLSSGLNSVLMPAMAHAHGVGGATRVNAMAQDSVRYFGFTGLILAGVGFLWAEPAVALLYGSGYEPATDALRVLVVVAGLTLPQSVFGALLTTTDHQRLRATIAGISLVLAAAAAIYAVPRYGLTGAVVANATAGILTFLAIATILTRRLSMRLPWSMLGGLFASAMLAAAAAAGLLWLHAGLTAHVVAGLVYAAFLAIASLHLGAWSAEDFMQLESLAAKHPRSLGWFARRLLGRIRP